MSCEPVIFRHSRNERREKLFGTVLRSEGFVDFFDYDSFVLCFEAVTCPPAMSADVSAMGLPTSLISASS